MNFWGGGKLPFLFIETILDIFLESSRNNESTLMSLLIVGTLRRCAADIESTNEGSFPKQKQNKTKTR